MTQASYSKPTQREIDRAETDLLINLSTLNEGENYAVMDPWSAQRLADAQTG